MLLKDLILVLEDEFGLDVWFVEDEHEQFSLEVSKDGEDLTPIWLSINGADGYLDTSLFSHDYLNADAEDITYHTKFGKLVFHGMPEDLSELIEQ